MLHILLHFPLKDCHNLFCDELIWQIYNRITSNMSFIAAGRDEVAAAPSAADPSGKAETSEQGSSALPVILSSNRRADISNFKGSTFVNIREYYEVSLRAAHMI